MVRLHMRCCVIFALFQQSLFPLVPPQLPWSLLVRCSSVPRMPSFLLIVDFRVSDHHDVALAWVFSPFGLVYFQLSFFFLCQVLENSPFHMQRSYPVSSHRIQRSSRSRTCSHDSPSKPSSPMCSTLFNNPKPPSIVDTVFFFCRLSLVF